MTARRLLGGAASLGAGQVAIQGLSFLRNLIVVRQISEKDVGIAATLILTLTLLDMISDLGSDKMLIQAADGDRETLQRTAHFFQFGRNLAIAAALFVLAGPAAWFFEVSHARWAFQCIALVPLMRGVAHLDAKRFQRALRYGPNIMVDLAAQLVPTLLAWPVTRWTGDYSAVVWLLLVQYGVFTLATQLVAERPYRWGVSRADADRLFVFGWPLLFNGLLLFLVFQGDRVVVAKEFAKEDLAVFSQAGTITWLPAAMMFQVAGSLLLPVLARSQEAPNRFRRHYEFCAQTLVLVNALVAIPLILVGGPLLGFLYGPGYAAAGAFIGWLAVGQVLRAARGAPTIAAMAVGDTKNNMISNFWRAAALAPLIAGVALGAGLQWVAAASALGEAMAFAASVRRLRVVQEIPVALSLKPLVIVMPPLVLAGVAAAFGPGMGVGLSLGAGVGLAVVAVGATLAFSPRYVQEFVTLAARVRAV